MSIYILYIYYIYIYILFLKARHINMLPHGKHTNIPFTLIYVSKQPPGISPDFSSICLKDNLFK